ncbi:hypothetical protein [Pseudorhodoplanes sp.]|uniref:hypothetical protein n=1 Tax=Pseudorhodoplanes sp. TaxID=1934341 RepID=UPI003D0B9D61
MNKTFTRQTFKQDADHGEFDEGGDGRGVAFEVAHKATVAADPGERSVNRPFNRALKSSCL